MKRTRTLWMAIFGLMLTGCATTQARLMPSETTITTSLWKSYEEARSIYDRIEPYRTTLVDLKNLVDPENTVSDLDRLPNVKFMDAVAIQNIFIKPGAGQNQIVPGEITKCLSEMFLKCHGYEMPYHHVMDRGVGNIFKRWLNFKKENIARGPDTIFQVFLKGNLVIFKRWEGTSNVDRRKLKINPLGPLQEPFELILKYMPMP